MKWILTLMLAALACTPTAQAADGKAAKTPPAPASAPTLPRPEADLSTLAPKDSAQAPAESSRPGNGSGPRGIDCEHYPARCR